jgi:hypothetical protein
MTAPWKPSLTERLSSRNSHGAANGRPVVPFGKSVNALLTYRERCVLKGIFLGFIFLAASVPKPQAISRKARAEH